ncbi:MAG: hypothetical protein JXA50_05685, partial [Deltaproteobacteria bacterium]|nr:hypothetical protein [Deltaproteobacteria bacterium]
KVSTLNNKADMVDLSSFLSYATGEEANRSAYERITPRQKDISRFKHDGHVNLLGSSIGTSQPTQQCGLP